MYCNHISTATDMNVMDAKLPSSQKSKKEKKPTMRFDIDLPESTNDSCPDYSYINLVRDALKEKSSKGAPASLREHQEQEERNEAEALAQYFEYQYGSLSVAGHKHRHKDRFRDLVDAGYGYDENDPFVDDSEAYDEIVPASLTTQHGGYYINIGKLNFREVSDQSDIAGSSSDDSVPLSHHVSKKKSKLNTSSKLDSGKITDGFKQGNCNGKKKRKKKMKHQEDHVDKKKRKILCRKDKGDIKQSAKKINKSSTSYAQKLIAKAKAQQMMNATFGSSVHSNNGTISPYKRSSSEEYGKHNILEVGGLEAIHDKDLAQVARQATKKLMNVGEMHSTTDDNPNRLREDSSSDTPKDPALPPGLPQLLGDKIDSLKKLAKSAQGEGKQKFFSSNVNRILLGIEEGSQHLRTKVRNGMYQHIANHLPCSKDTLMKRLKKLQVDDCDQQLKGPIEKLRVAVDAVMTSQIQRYVTECAAHAKLETKLDDSRLAASTDEDDDCDYRSMISPPEGNARHEKMKRTYTPRRKFKWDDNIRTLLCDVVRVKIKAYERFKVREKQTPEEYLKVFLETVVKQLWPKPWMQAKILFKESRSVHSHLTDSSRWPKQKKVESGKKVTGLTKEVKLADSPKTEFKSARMHSVPGNKGLSLLPQQKASANQLLYEKSSGIGQTFSPSILAPCHPAGIPSNTAGNSINTKRLLVETSGSPMKYHPHVDKEPLANLLITNLDGNFMNTTKRQETTLNERHKRLLETQVYETGKQTPNAKHFYTSDWLKTATSLMMEPSSNLSLSAQCYSPAASNLPLPEYGTFLKIRESENSSNAGDNPLTDKFQFKIVSPSIPVGHVSKGENVPAARDSANAMDKRKVRGSLRTLERHSEGLRACSSTRVKNQGAPLLNIHSSLRSTSATFQEPIESFAPTAGHNQPPDSQDLLLCGHDHACSRFTTGDFSSSLSQSGQRGSVNESALPSDELHLRVSCSRLESGKRNVSAQSAYTQSFGSSYCFTTQLITDSSNPQCLSQKKNIPRTFLPLGADSANVPYVKQDPSRNHSGLLESRSHPTDLQIPQGQASTTTPVVSLSRPPLSSTPHDHPNVG